MARRCKLFRLFGQGLKPADKSVNLRPLSASKGRNVVMLMAFQRVIPKRGDELAPLQPLLHQPFSPHRHANVVHRGNHRQVGAIEAYARRGRQINAKLLRPAVPLVGAGIIAPSLPVVQQSAVAQLRRPGMKFKASGIFRAANRQVSRDDFSAQNTRLPSCVSSTLRCERTKSWIPSSSSSWFIRWLTALGLSDSSSAVSAKD